jgi:acyl-coenzyme A thioesterase PaaI-like protein
MALADTLGAIATVANLAEGTTTTTIESKTNFFAAIPVGDTARAECTPLHRGRTTMVWQTSASSRLRIGVGDFGNCWDTSKHKEVSHEQEVCSPAVG